MQIYPQDLGDGNYAYVLNARRGEVASHNGLAPKSVAAFLPMPLTPMRRLWMRGLGVDDQTAEQATPAFSLCNRAAVQWIPTGFQRTWLRGLVIAALVGTVGFFLWPLPLLYFGLLRPRAILKEMHRRLSLDEIADLARAARDPLADDFFGLVEAALQTPRRVSPQDAEKMRAALYAVGNSISLLPLLEVAPEDADGLQAEAHSLTREARTERDPVVAASLERRAEALRQRAASAKHSNTILRRSRTLRAELREQIGALRASLTTAALSTDQYADRLAGVAAGVQEIAGPANALAAAQAELERAFLGTVPAASSTAPKQIRLG